MKLMKKF